MMNPLSPPPPYFSAKHLSAGYNGVPVVRDITLSVDRGQILTLIGPNGSGKSTVLKTLSGRLPPVSGGKGPDTERILLDGKPLASFSRKELARKIAVMTTEPIQTENMTAGEIAEAGRYPYTGSFGILSEADREITADALRTARADNLAGQDFMTLSDGQRQRVLLARALAQEPELLILDEPTSYLDIRHQLELLEILKILCDGRKTAVIMSLHELFLAERVSDQIVCIRDGRVDRSGTPAEIFSGDYIDRLYDLPQGTYDALLRRP